MHGLRYRLLARLSRSPSRTASLLFFAWLLYAVQSFASEADLSEELVDIFPSAHSGQLTLLPVAPPQEASPIPSEEIAEIIARVALDAARESNSPIRVLSSGLSINAALSTIYRREGQENWQKSVVSLLREEADLALIGEATQESGLFGLRLKLMDLNDGSYLGATELLPLAMPSPPAGDPVAAINEAVRRLYDRVPEARNKISIAPFVDGLVGATSPAGRYLSQVVADAWLAAGSGLNQQITGAAVPEVVHEKEAEGSFLLTGTIWRYDAGQAQLRLAILEDEAERASERVQIATGRLPPQVRATLAEDYLPKTPSATSIVEVFPRRAAIGDELTLTVEVPEDCDPAFYDVAGTGRITPIPTDIFELTLLNEDMLRFEISRDSRYGLVIQEGDAPGWHAIGVLCRGFAETSERDILRSVLDTEGQRRITGANDAGAVAFHFAVYEVRRRD